MSRVNAIVDRHLAAWARSVFTTGFDVDVGGTKVTLDPWHVAIAMGVLHARETDRPTGDIAKGWSDILAGRERSLDGWLREIGQWIKRRMVGTRDPLPMSVVPPGYRARDEDAYKALVGSLLSNGWRECSEQEADVVWKGKGKYIKRVRKPGGGYRYFYKVSEGGGIADTASMTVGTSYRFGDGFYRIGSVSGDKLRLRHSVTGEALDTTKREFAQMIHVEHATAISAHRATVASDLADVQEYGSDEQRRLLEAEARKWGVRVDSAPWLTPAEKRAWVAATDRAGVYVTSITDKARQRVQDLTSIAVDRGWSKERLQESLERSWTDSTRDWKRVARTELQGAYNEGTVVHAVDLYGAAARVARVPESGACEHCLRLFLGPNGRPIIWYADELAANGTNVGRKPDQWKATIWPVHPNCLCGSVLIPPGKTLDHQWKLVKERGR